MSTARVPIPYPRQLPLQYHVVRDTHHPRNEPFVPRLEPRVRLVVRVRLLSFATRSLQPRVKTVYLHPLVSLINLAQPRIHPRTNPNLVNTYQIAPVPLRVTLYPTHSVHQLVVFVYLFTHYLPVHKIINHRLVSTTFTCVFLQVRVPFR